MQVPGEAHERYTGVSYVARYVNVSPTAYRGITAVITGDLSAVRFNKNR